jgi:hypothetical protein
MNKALSSFAQFVLRYLSSATLALTVLLIPSGVKATTPIVIIHEEIVESGDIYDGIEFPVGTTVYLDQHDVVGGVVLSQDFKIGGYTILGGTQLYTLNGKLASFVSRDGQTIGDIVLKSGAHLIFKPDGSLDTIRLATDNTIQGYLFEANGLVNFYPNGKLRLGTLAQPTRIGNVDCYSGTIAFEESGELKSCVGQKNLKE